MTYRPEVDGLRAVAVLEVVAGLEHGGKAAVTDDLDEARQIAHI